MKPQEFLSQMRPVTLQDKGVFSRYYGTFAQEICEATFAERFLWGESRKHLWGELDGHLIVSFQKRDGDRMWYAPVGPNPMGLMRGQMKPSDGFRYFYVPEFVANEMKNETTVKETPGHFDYVYSVDAMRKLEGKPYAEKRNFINRARKAGAQVIRLSGRDADACVDLLRRWAAEQPREGESSLLDEESALSAAMANFFPLDLFGVGITINGRLEAFSFGCPISKTMFVEYFEKATTAVPGLYPLVLHELCSALPAPFTELNFEEDLDIPGLRIAKQRWSPSRMIKKYEILA